MSFGYIWVNYNISLTWINAIWGCFPLSTMIPVRSQWGRYNLPIYIYAFNDTISSGRRFMFSVPISVSKKIWRSEMLNGSPSQSDKAKRCLVHLHGLLLLGHLVRQHTLRLATKIKSRTTVSWCVYNVQVDMYIYIHIIQICVYTQYTYIWWEY